MKKDFLKPITLVALTVFTNLADTAKTEELKGNKELTSIQQELIKIKNFRDGITKEQFLAPNDRVLTAELVKNMEGTTFYHRSHYSHQSHQSHRSHYSSSW